MAPREPDAHLAGLDADDTHADTRGRRGRRQGDEHVLQLDVGRGRRGRGQAQRRPMQPAGRGARGEVAQEQLHRIGVRRRRRRPNRLTDRTRRIL